MKNLSIRWWLLLAWLSTAVLGNVFFEVGGRFLRQNEANQFLNEMGLSGFMQFALPLFLLLLPALIIGWFLERMVLRPLAAMSQAAQQIAIGDLNFYLPPPRVREVAEVFTAFHAMGHALRTSLERQANLEQERRLFISAIAHDLRTPLFALRGYLEGLTTRVATTPEKVAHYLAVCQEQANLLEQRVANLFAYARLEYLNQAPQLEPLDLYQLLAQIIERFHPHLKAKGINHNLTHTETLPIVAADKQLLTRVIENLLDNAIRYTPSGGTINIQVNKDNGKGEGDREGDREGDGERNKEGDSSGVYFTVTDSGPGIAPADLPHLFTPRYLSDTSRQRVSANNTGGAGLGLMIAYQILQAHGGRLFAKNNKNGGAEFSAWLPARENEQ